MTRTVILIRHAKSSWSNPLASDHDRVLNDRGRRSAPAIGQWLAEKGYQPDAMLVSDAARTRETADLIVSALPVMPTIELRPDFYHAAPDTMLQALRSRSEDTIAIVGHNPGIAFLAQGLVSSAPDHPRFVDYPTAATTVIAFGKEIAPQMGRCLDFVVPRDLIG